MNGRKSRVHGCFERNFFILDQEPESFDVFFNHPRKTDHFSGHIDIAGLQFGKHRESR